MRPWLTGSESIGPKIEAEDQAALAPGPSTARKTSGVDVFRGRECSRSIEFDSFLVLSNVSGFFPATYQFGYYLQKAEHHSVLIKVTQDRP